MPNACKETLQRGRPVYGSMVPLPAPMLVEMCGWLGFDFVLFDTEHTTLGLDDLEHMVRAAELAGVTPFARVYEAEPQTMLRYLDAGVLGLMVPHVQSVDQARAAVDAVKYHPLGHRGLGYPRSARYGLGEPINDYVRHANAETMLIGMIEDEAGLRAAGPLAAVDGLDVLHFGPADLAQSLGHPGEPGHPKVTSAISDAVAHVRAAGKTASMVADTAEAAQAAYQVGARMLLSNVGRLFIQAARGYLASVPRD